jgi:hypothetical protein
MKHTPFSLTAQHLREVLHYEPDTGIFTWLKTRRAGAVAGSKKEDGYIRISIRGRDFKASRLAWLYMTGEWPSLLVDHEDRDRGNNRWRNLRQVTHKQNRENTTPTGHGTSGRIGVSWDSQKQRWLAHICHNYQLIRLGRHSTLIDAVAARMRSERLYFTHAATR